MVKIYVGLLIVMFGGLIAIEFSRDRPINWSKTYRETDKIPFGTFVLYDQLPTLFPNSTIDNIKVTPFEYFDEYYNWADSSYSINGSYIHIDEYTEIDDVSAQELLDFASHGNDVFLATSYPPQRFYDSLNFDIKNQYELKGTAKLQFTNPKFAKDSVTIENDLSNIYFSKLDAEKTTVLGYQKFKYNNQINFVKIDHGFGHIYLHLQPIVFTNYHLLKKEHKNYAEVALSYLPDTPIFYDYHNKFTQELGSSPLRFVLNQPALRTAWYLGLLSLFLFMVFNAKRKQRVVRVIKPLENTTVAFTKTIGNLYYETKDHNNLIDKKITYFLEYIRRIYYLDTQILNDKFVKNLTIKSGKDITTTKRLIDLIVSLKAKAICTEADLLNLNNTIEDFYKA